MYSKRFWSVSTLAKNCRGVLRVTVVDVRRRRLAWTLTKGWSSTSASDGCRLLMNFYFLMRLYRTKSLLLLKRLKISLLSVFLCIIISLLLHSLCSHAWSALTYYHLRRLHFDRHVFLLLRKLLWHLTFKAWKFTRLAGQWFFRS